MSVCTRRMCLYCCVLGFGSFFYFSDYDDYADDDDFYDNLRYSLDFTYSLGCFAVLVPWGTSPLSLDCCYMIQFYDLFYKKFSTPLDSVL